MELSGSAGRGVGPDTPTPLGCGSRLPLEPRRTSIVLLFDVSSSWGAEVQPYWRRDLKWEPMVAAAKAFFTDPDSERLSATLTFFPNELAFTIGQGLAPSFGTPGERDAGTGPPSGLGGTQLSSSAACDREGYLEPDVALTALPTDAFNVAIDAVTPVTEDDWRLSSPVEAVLDASFDLAVALQSERPEDDVILLMITDGYPALCGGADGDVQPSVDLITQRAGAPLYVIGVRDPVTEEEPNPPDEATKLHELTRASGTGDAYLIDTGDPAVTEQGVGAALRDVASRWSCGFRVPLPSDGMPFDPDAVNVSLSNEMGATPLVYDATCGAGVGWHYDDSDAPRVIQLCQQSCIEAQSSGVTMEIGCVNPVTAP